MLQNLSTAFSKLSSTAPAAVTYGCFVLFILWVGCVIYLTWSSLSLQRDIRALSNMLEPFRRVDRPSSKMGLTLQKLDSIRKYGNSLEERPRLWWVYVNDATEPYENSDGEETWFLSEGVREVLPYEFIVGKNFNAPFFGSVPSILTGIGLTLTFTAILIGLLGVHYDKTSTVEPISGIDTLINGLSGKFLSSIVALALSIVFTLLERFRIRALRNSYERVASAVSEAIPFLSPSRILLDIQRSSAKASVSVSHISSEVVDRLLNGFNEKVVPGLTTGMSQSVAGVFEGQLGPTLNRMTGSLDDLQRSIVRLEGEKQTSVTNELQQLLSGLERSLTTALAEMATRFHDALSGSARQEFGNVQGTLEATRQLLGEMNGQFAAMQTAFNSVVTQAQQTTTEQLSSGREQTEALTGLMRGLMTQLEDSANRNLSSMQAQLTKVVEDLAGKVGLLSSEMLAAAQGLTERSEQSASNVIKQTDAWSEATARRLDALMLNIEDRSKDFKEASNALLDAKAFVNNLLADHGKALAQLTQAAQTVQAYTADLRSHADAMKTVNVGHAAVVGQLRVLVDAIKAGMEQHQNLLIQYRTTFSEYQGVIEGLHEPLARIMRTTSDGLRDYNEKVHQNFDGIVRIADKLVPQAASMLHAQIDELKEQLEDLGSAISKAVSGANGRPQHP